MYISPLRTTSTAPGRTALAMVAILSVLISLFAITQPALATHAAFEPIQTSGEGADPRECEGFDFGYKIDAGDLVAGVHAYTSTDGLFSVTLNFDTTAQSISFSSASPAVSRFVVKGGNEEPNDGRTTTDYASPVTAGGPSSPPGGAGVSHVTFCGFTPPTITVDKTGDVLSKVGDQVSYTVTIRNTGSITAHKVSITDTLAGDLTANAGCGASLAPAASCQITYTLTVPAGASDPWVNEVTAVYTSRAAGAGGRATVSESHSVNLFQPAITVAKTATPTSVPVGGTISYRISIRNTGSADSPALVLDTIADSLQGNLKTACAATLAVGAECVITYTRPAGTTAGQVCNTVSVTSHPDGFPNNIAGSSTACVTVTAQEVTLGGNPTPTPTPTPVVRESTLAGSLPNTAMDGPMTQLPVIFLALLTLGSLGYLGRRNLIGIRNRR